MFNILGVLVIPIKVYLFEDFTKSIYISLLSITHSLLRISLFYLSISMALKDIDISIISIQYRHSREKRLFRFYMPKSLISLSILFKEIYYEYRRP